MPRIITKWFFRIFIISVLTSSNSSIYGQNNVDVKINFNNVESKDLIVKFEDGKFTEGINFNHSDSSIIIKRPYYTIYARVLINYKDQYLSFFVDSIPSTLNLYYDESKGNKALYSKHSGSLIPIYDTTTNEFLRELRQRQDVDLKKLSYEIEKHGSEISKSDSLKNEISHLAKTVNQKSLLSLKEQPDNFFSFYYFIDQVIGISSLIEYDSNYYVMLLSYFNETFPEKYLSSSDGRRTIDILQKKISPTVLKINDVIPLTKLIDISGKEIPLRNFKEKYLLLDFWASWCGPCLRQIPDIKRLENELSNNEVKLIGISIDRDSTAFINAKTKKEMNWTHVFDKRNLIVDNLGIESIPTLLLIDRNGKILYRDNGSGNFVREIKAIVND